MFINHQIASGKSGAVFYSQIAREANFATDYADF